MNILEQYINLVERWGDNFDQKRTLLPAIRLSLGSIGKSKRGTISQVITFCGRDQQDWSSDYKFFSRSNWDHQYLFQPVIEECLHYFKEDYIAIGFDETKINKTGKKIPGTQYHRDPLSPPFHLNFMFGIRELQGSALLPLYNLDQENPTSSRGIPILFENIPVVKKPGKKATEDEIKNYEAEKKVTNLSTYFVKNVKEVRSRIDQAGGYKKTLIAIGDGSFCNKTVFTADFDRINILSRCRKDASLCFKETGGNPKKFYSSDNFSPEEIRINEKITWEKENCFIGGKYRAIRYKEIDEVYWQRGAKRKPLRLFVIAPMPYKVTKNGKTYYKDPAYLLTDNLNIPAQEIIQMYIDRWQIEVNNRDEKTILGVGEAQVRNIKSVTKQPAFVVSSYSILMLASLASRGTMRTDEYYPLPKWRKSSKRPSCNDLVNALLKEIILNKEYLRQYGMFIEPENILGKSVL